jgi:hypothetical protein
MKNRLVFCFALAGLALANAKSYSMNLYQPAMVGTTELKAGEYQVELVDQKAIITKGKVHAEAAVTVGNADKKYASTSVVIGDVNGKPHLQEIHLGGTTTKLVLAE